MDNVRNEMANDSACNVYVVPVRKESARYLEVKICCKHA